jgi:hypothetical protein
MPTGRRRRPARRLIVTLAALASLIIGYYLGQAWQRQPLESLSAMVYASGKPVDYPPYFDPGSADNAAAVWRLVTVVDTQAEACKALRRELALAMNRLADRPDIQQRLRLTVLAYNDPDDQATQAFTGGHDWIDVIGGTPARLDELAGQIGLLPTGDDWCQPTQDNAVLISPDAKAWALIPREPPVIMAETITVLIDFVE